jgi:hypothetical protein
MTAPSRRWQLAGLLLLTWVSMACNPLTVPYFLFGGLDPKNDAKCKLVGEDKKKAVKVVVFASTPLEVRPELISADRELAALLSQKLQERAKENKDNVIVASSTKVQKFKDDHPNWQSLSLEELGKRLDADFVIDIEINRMSLYQAGSQNTLFLGKADVSVTVVNVNKNDNGPIFHEECSCEYPRSQGPRPVTDTNPLAFRRAFLSRLALELSWLFTDHPTQDNYTCE